MDERQKSFTRLFDGNDDPWEFRTRWYEARKRALTLACLPAPHYRRAYEPGCANGELSAALSPRCGQLMVSDGVEAAVALARQRLKEFSHVEVFKAWIPQDWPEGPLDLLVLSEVGFYLSASELADLVGKLHHSLLKGGTVLACHWRHQIKGFELSGDAVHQTLHGHLSQGNMARLVHHEETDFVLDVWSTDARSVAQRDGML